MERHERYARSTVITDYLNKIKLGLFGWSLLVFFLGLCVLGFINQLFIDSEASYIDYVLILVDSFLRALSILNPFLPIIIPVLNNLDMILLALYFIVIFVYIGTRFSRNVRRNEVLFNSFIISVIFFLIILISSFVKSNAVTTKIEPIFGAGKNRIILHTLANSAILTLQISILSIIVGFFIALMLALILISTTQLFGLKYVAQSYIDFFRSTPLLTQILLVTFAIPIFSDLSPAQAGIIALSLNTGAYQAEIIRAGIVSIPTGQNEASRGLGMTTMQTMRYVILPQALRLIIPPFTNEGINVLLNSSLLMVISVPELARSSKDLSAFYFTPFEILFTGAIFYFIMAFSLAKLTKRLEEKYRIPGLGLATE